MNTKSKVLALAATVASMTLIAPEAEAANRYGLVCVHNATDSTINYLVRLSNNSWSSISVSPSSWRSHYVEYAYLDQNSSPPLFIRFDADLSRGTYFVEYELSKHASPFTNCNYYGNDYVFVYDASGIDLVEW